MKVLLIHQYFLHAEGSGGSRWNEMIKYWSQKNVEVTVLAGMIQYTTGKKHTANKGKYFREEQIGKNTKVIWCHVSEKYNKNFLGRFWGYISFVISSLLAGLFKTGSKYDLIIATSPPLFVGITALILSIFKKKAIFV